MNDRSKKLEAIFHDSSELGTPEERERYLKVACAGDENLRREVEALLGAAAIGDNLFHSVEQSSVRFNDSASEHPGEQPGGVIGRYKLLQKIGEGGMGVVYMAEQEKPVRRKIALKIIKLGMDTRQVVARFEAERQALALMDSPHIAQVFDGGATEAGRPYFVMELVQGVPITEFCDANKLSIPERLHLFIPVCQAIQSAHQKGIIHRDIKPSNVLVTMHHGAPHPMVIDFGVAKAIDQKLTEKTLFTNFATMIGTPAYMSPEQAEMSKLDVDTRSDIYSLGVLLYELLTGTTPFPEERLRRVAYGEMQRIIAEEQPERPSTRLKKLALARSASPLASRPSPLASDLDWIVLKCLEKDRSRRYDTANALAADIQACLKQEPVIARPPTTAYRFQKFVRRNKLPFTAAMFALVALLGAVVVSSWQAVRARRAENIASEQRAIAKTESASATAAKDFLIENLLGVSRYSKTPDSDAMTFEATQALVRKVARRIEGRFPNQPLVEAEIRLALITGLTAAADNEQAVFQAEKALPIFRAIQGAGNSNTLDTIKELAAAKYYLGQKEEAFAILREAIDIERHSTNGPSGPRAALIGSYGGLLADDGRAAEGLPYVNEAVTFFENDKDSPYAVDWRLTLARVTELCGDLEKAEELHREVYQDAVRVYGAEAFLTLQQQKRYADLLTQLNKWDKALPLLEEAASLTKAKYGGYPALRAQFSLARAYEQNDQTGRARSLYLELHPQFAKHFSFEPATRDAITIADFFVRQKEYQEAAAVFDSLRGEYEKRPPQTPKGFEWLVRVAATTNGWPAAAEIYRKEFDRFPDSLSIWLNKAWVFRYTGDEESYRRVVGKVLAAPSSIVTINYQHLPIEIAGMGSILFSGEQKKQLGEMIDALEVALPGCPTTQQARGYRAIGHLELRLGHLDQCLAALEKSAKKQTSPDPYTLFIRALCLHQQGRPAEARRAFDQAEAIVKPLLDSFSQSERFLPADELYQQVLMYRETQALLGLK